MVARRALALVLVASSLTASIPSEARAAGDAATGPAVAFGNWLLRDTEVRQLLDSVVGELSPATVEQIEQIALLASSGATPQEIEQQLEMIVCGLLPTESNIRQLTSRLSSVGGSALMASALLKFQQHKDNPTQRHIGEAVALFFTAVILLIIPSCFKSTGVTLLDRSSRP